MSSPLINLLRGWPNENLLPASLLKNAASRALSDPAIWQSGLEYGPDPGHQPLRRAVAAWLTDFYDPQQPVQSDRITITGGASQNLACLLQVFSDPAFTRNVWISSPAYMLAFRIFDDAGLHAKLRSVPEDESGMDDAYLRREIERSEERARRQGNNKPLFKPSRPWAKVYRHIIYCVPSFSNPSSISMPLARREKLVRLAREYDALIVTDDVYDFLQWPADLTHLIPRKANLPRLVDIDRFLDGGAERQGADGFGNVASNGSFSKICGPGLRTGWVEGTPSLANGVSQTGSTRSGGAPSQLTSTYISLMLETGELQRHVHETLQPAYGSRYRTMMTAIDALLVPLGVTLPQSTPIVGGYFVWLTLPAPLKGADVARLAKEENLIVAEGDMFQVPGDSTVSFPCDIRLCFSYEPEANLTAGIERLAARVRHSEPLAVISAPLDSEPPPHWQ
ncbi:PLP-dependent transferase [Saccharata proteae CBS 121410]|uniref:PLP-dependent transferase n=1 Tax=Saccharata proteae CBS 121410 TaxID=1314787 RepID=A0A9P4LV13_9PEZI|nr:PLP-dependent transferase [Saccharata proteae CBS 121410]